MKKHVILVALCTIAISSWAQDIVDRQQYELSLIDTYMTKIRDSQNFEKYLIGGIFVGVGTTAALVGLDVGSWGILGVYGGVPLAVLGIPILLIPSGADFARWEYDALPERTPDEIALKISAGNKTLGDLKDRSVAGKIIFGSLLLIVGGAAVALSIAEDSGNGPRDLFLGVGLTLIGFGVLEIVIPSYSELQYQEYRSLAQKDPQ